MKTKNWNGLILLLLLLCPPTTQLAAQTAERDAASGEFRIEYVVDGVRYTATVYAWDRIAPRIALLSVDSAVFGYQYRYRVANASTGQAFPGRGIWEFDFPCADVEVATTTRLADAVRWKFTAQRDDGGVQVCRFNAPRRGVLDPGDSVTGLGIASAWLPGIASVTFRGLGGFDSIPTAENTPDSVHALVRWVHGTGRTLAMVLPVRPPQTVADGRTALMAVISDLATTCAESQWIDDTGICRSLQAKLTAASAALSREQFPTSRNQLSAFRAELDAQRGKHVNENAYFLLRVLADHAMSLLH